MKSIKYTLTICLMTFSLSVFADKKMTIRNSDTGESFEVTVPDGLRIYEYNSNWLDSIPYLMEHTRYGEPWAFEALGDCYRYGKGGLTRNFNNAIMAYDFAGKDIGEFIDTVRQNNEDDPMSVFARMVDYIENKDYDRIVCAIDTLNELGYHSADILREYISRRNDGIKKSEVVEFLASPGADADACLFAAAGHSMCELKDTTDIDVSWIKPLILDKIPFLYSEIGVRKYEDTIKADNAVGYADDATESDLEDRKKAVEYLLRADEHSILSKKAAGWLYHYCTQDPSSDWVGLNDEDLYRIGIIAGEVR